MPGFLTNDLPTLAQVGQNMRIPVDTEFPRGVNPASIAATALQVASAMAECPVTTALAAGAVSVNWLGGSTPIPALNTAPGAAFTMTLNNTLITAAYLAAGGMPEIGLYSGGATPNTGGTIPPLVMSAMMVLQSVVPTVGSCVFTWVNQGATALNGTMTAVWHL